MDKHQVASILDEIGTLLELQGESSFRCNAYRNAARALEQMEDNLSDLVAANRLGQIAGIGETLKEKITLLSTTGQLPFYEDLKRKTPPGLVEMLRIAGMGPKKVKVLYEQLGIENLQLLKSACEAGRVAGLKGFGAKTQQKILDGLEFLGKAGDRVRIDEALSLANTILEELGHCPDLEAMELCGSLRRRKETVRDIDVLVSSANPAPIMDRFISLPGIIQQTGRGDTKASIVLECDMGRGRKIAMNADLRVVESTAFPFALHYFTGSKEHNVAIRGLAQQRGLKLNEYELASKDGAVACKDEEAIYRVLGLDYIPPELRENTGEVQAAAEHRLPKLIEAADLCGTFHCHSTWSDGSGTIMEMARAAQKLGYEYLGIADHSQSLTVANGLTPERVRQQWAEIEAARAGMPGFTIFKGTECDILPDGRLDYPDELLSQFDYVVASVHSHFNMSQEEMTRRIIRAVSNPHVTILGHATGRLLLRRDGYKVDLDAVLKEAAARGTLVEINAHPQRLDIDWVHCKRAKALGVKLVINPDAHSPGDIALISFGIDVARRGWLEKKDVFNTQSAAAVAKAFVARKG